MIYKVYSFSPKYFIMTDHFIIFSNVNIFPEIFFTARNISHNTPKEMKPWEEYAEGNQTY